MIFPKSFSLSEDRIIYWALVGSCVLHAIFLGFAYFVIPSTIKPQIKPMEIRYVSKAKEKVEQRPSRIESVSDLKESRKNIQTPEASKVLEKQLSGASFMRDAVFGPKHVEIKDKQPLKMANLVEKRSISVPVITTQKITNPKYVGYNDRIRDKIRNRAYFYIDDPKFQAGEVYLTFVLTADGNLKDLKIIDDRSHANDYLRSVGLRSVKESSPFPPFPGDLPYPELSFNVVISFEVSDN